MKPNLKSVYIRFYEELNDFLPVKFRKVRFKHIFIDRTSVKDLIESLGVPHTEIDLILINGKSVSFEYIITNGDDISVYPVFESFDISDLQHLRPEPLRQPGFICDVHLGKLLKNLRMLGIDTQSSAGLIDQEVISVSVNDKKTVLTRNIGLLKHSMLTHGYFVRNVDPIKQTAEVIRRFQLEKSIREFTRCLECNSPLRQIDRDKIIDKIPDKVKMYQVQFCICESCDKIFWNGTHLNNMMLKIKKIREG